MLKRIFNTFQHKFFFRDDDFKYIPPRDYWVNPSDSFLHFSRWTWEYLLLFKFLNVINIHSSILELGCHHGRTAIGLAYYLKKPAKYFGIDVMKKQIDWANNHFDSSIFKFVHADIYHEIFNPKGSIKCVEYVFPFKEKSFDLIFAASVFTHLFPQEVEHYFKEIYRTLKDNGNALLSFCLFNNSIPQKTINLDIYSFQYPLDQNRNVFIKEKMSPTKAVAYKYEFIKTLCKKANLKIKKVFYGYFRKDNPNGYNEQDLIWIVRRS